MFFLQRAERYQKCFDDNSIFNIIQNSIFTALLETIFVEYRKKKVVVDWIDTCYS